MSDSGDCESYRTGGRERCWIVKLVDGEKNIEQWRW